MSDMINPPKSQSLSVQQSSEIQAPSSEKSDCSSLIIDLCMEVADNLSQSRKSKLSGFSGKQQETIQAIENAIKSVREAYSKYVEDPNGDNKYQVTQAHKNLISLIEKEKCLGKEEIPRSSPPFQEQSLQQLRVWEEIILNKVYNRFQYENEVLENVNKDRDLLFKEFNVPIDAEIKVLILPGETHNGGKKACLIGYKQDGKIIKFVYKPRDSRVDQEILSTFQKINSLQQEEKSQPYLLPEYKIVNLSDNKASIWEYIPGPNLGKKGGAPTPAGKDKRITSNENLKKQLLRLDDVLSKMNVSDLHGENVILKKNEEEVITEVVPVDLENVYIQPNRKIPTNLRTGEIRENLKEEWKELTGAENALIKEFINKSSGLLVRYIPIGTTQLIGLIATIDNADAFANLLKNGLKQDGIQFTSDESTIKKKLLEDLLQEDVPFFTEIKGIVYYGTPDRNLVIGERKNV
jgi:hypothetical protein